MGICINLIKKERYEECVKAGIEPFVNKLSFKEKGPILHKRKHCAKELADKVF